MALAALGIGLHLKARLELGWSFWLVFSAAYLFMSMDECALVHEAVGQHGRVKWVYAYARVAAVFFLYCVWNLTRRTSENDRTVSSLILGGMIVFAIGDMGFELVDLFRIAAHLASHNRTHLRRGP